MRLLSQSEDGKLLITSDKSQTTPYAILSHTWLPDDEEVTYVDIVSRTAITEKLGKAKLDFCLAQAAKDGLHSVWIDTCCINKQDMNELGRALNQMYKWYQTAAVCYVLLWDVTHDDWQDTIIDSKWFTRGWTLQELIAPTKLRFYSKDGHYLGDKLSLSKQIFAATGIDTSSAAQASLTTKFSWSLSRTTTEPEDLSYCMLGLLGVAMYANYGEGAENAQERLLAAVHDKHGRDAVRAITRAIILHDLEKSSAVANVLSDERILDSLSFDNMNSRRSTISDPLDRTCQWLHQHSHYQRWIWRSGEHFLWLKGRAGTGKSVLVKFAESSASEQHVRISFYFHARGSDLEKTTLGMYRSLLFQLLSRIPRLHKHARRQLESLRHYTGKLDWTLAALQDTLKAAVKDLGQPVLCFIDALDECADSVLQPAIYFLEDLCRQTQLYIFFASRYYPTVIIRALEIELEHQSSHARDLALYVTARLNADSSLQHEVIRKANGIFLWAVLVVGQLNKHVADGNPYRLQETLSALPSELDDLFQAIISRDDDNERFQHAMQLILFSRGTLRGSLFLQLMLVSLPSSMVTLSEVETAWHTELASVKRRDIEAAWRTQLADVRRFVTSVSRGLAEVTAGDSGNVQFIHESLREFFVHSTGPERLFGNNHDDREAACHDGIKTICQAFIALDLRSSATAPQVSGPLFEIWNYCINNVIWHADFAARSIPVRVFLCSPVVARFCFFLFKLSSPPEEMHDERLVLQDYLVACLAAWNAPRLLREACQMGCTVDSTQNPLGRTPLDLAIFAGSHECVKALLQCGVDVDSRNELGQTVLAQAVARPASHQVVDILLSGQADPDAVDDTGGSVLHRAVESRLDPTFTALGRQQESPTLTPQIHKRIINLKHLAHIGYFTDDSKDKFIVSGNPEKDKIKSTDICFPTLTRQGRLCMLPDYHIQKEDLGESHIQSLLKWHANVNLGNPAGLTPLMYASLYQDIPAIEMLYKSHSLDLEARSVHGMTALNIACGAGATSSVRMLLKLGADANTAIDTGCSALLATCSHGLGHFDLSFAHAREIARLAPKWYGNAQSYQTVVAVQTIIKLARQTHPCDHEIAKLLLLHGADPNRQDESGLTALAAACSRGSSLQLIRLLLKHKADCEAADLYGRTALMVACVHNIKDAALLLIGYGVNLKARDYSGVSVLAYLARWCDDGEIQLALSLRSCEVGITMAVTSVFRRKKRDHSPELQTQGDEEIRHREKRARLNAERIASDWLDSPPSWAVSALEQRIQREDGLS